MKSIIFIKNAENLTIYGNDGNTSSAPSQDSKPKEQVIHSIGNASIDRTPGEFLLRALVIIPYNALPGDSNTIVYLD